ncbi:uncharacterized protein E0L32_010068 [Thyridium curvatum]|uniref:J domain-containing protein n=1 Tax=Thyridium curvatum TaxID=1093900 RepID=A0A507AU72_9PEZI|nr:uncharacterized protein E0L32_010068 [Thyridium curvatum]TPX08451.1 hypothetical protein E0L32_010068 [Thyridium curvatum]
MVKLDYSRDYYADLELSPTADVNDVKKQFRKLALKYHPDRNPGREAEVNSRFQTIQSAHEVLTSPDQKTKYDTHRRSRYPSASGVKGNPWQNVSSQFPTPPKRPPMNRKTTSGAQRYSSFGVPPTAKSAREDPNTRYQAWEDMRPKSKGKTGPAPTAPRTPRTESSRPQNPTRPEPRTMPRTASQQQKANASFGTARRQGFVPRSPGPDEPPVASSNYFTTRYQPSLFNDLSANSAFKTQRTASGTNAANMFRDSTIDPRQSTPYQTHGGEKTNPFDGADIRRSGSTREPPRRQQNAANTGRARSSSVPDIPDSPTPAPRKSATRQQEDPNAKFAGVSSSTSKFGERYRPQSQTQPSMKAFTAPNSSTTSLGSDSGEFGFPISPCIGHANKVAATVNGGNGPSAQKDDPSVYATPLAFSYPSPYPVNPGKENTRQPKVASAKPAGNNKPAQPAPNTPECDPQTSPSGRTGSSERVLNPFEQTMFDVLSHLASPPAANSTAPSDLRSSSTPVPPTAAEPRQADNSTSSSFSFHVDNETFTRTTPDPARFSRSSADNINTRFVAEEHANADWKFNAGGGVPLNGSPIPPNRRSQSGSRLGRRSPAKDRARPKPASVNEQDETNGDAQTSGFNAGEWTDKIGNEHFFAPQRQQTSTSPTRNARPLKKPRPVRATMGTAGLVDEDETSSEERTRPGTGTGSASGVESPSAMDIDPPMPPPPAAASGSAPQNANGARNIPVEPERPDWRAGNAAGLKSKAGASINLPANNAAGSEDTDDFRASFADLKKTEPFAPSATGLNSFQDLKSNLPFESKASATAPVPKPKPSRINFPVPPPAPPPPAALAVPGLKPSAGAWEKYVWQFGDYMQEWATFNNRYVDHFQARRNTFEKQRRGSNGTKGGFAWLATKGDDGIREYLGWMEQDREVRTKWAAAASEHEMHVREFMAHRDRMKQ